MNGKKLLRRLSSLLLAAVTLGGLLSFPSTRADETGFDLNGTAFTEPELDTGIMYFWHEGIPSVSKDKNGNFIKYPVIISWNDRYYLCTDGSFKGELNETHTLQEKKNDHYIYIFMTSLGGIGGDAFDNYDRVWGDAGYYMRYLYDMSGDALLSKLNLDLNSLYKYGESVSINTPANLPYLVAAKPETDQYAIGLSQAAFGADTWLVGKTRTWEEIITGAITGWDNSQSGDVQWGLDYQYWALSQFADKNYTYSTTRSLYGGYTKTYTEGPDQHYWTIKKDANGKYHFWTTGESDVSGMERVSGSVGVESHANRTKEWHSANDIGRMGLYYSGSTVGVSAETVCYKDWKDRVNTVGNTDGFKVYYGDPNIVSFHKHSFEVVSGQVVNLDGPRVIDSNCTITVHSGGVLACSGWVINNGQILVEPGGLIILQGRTTATGDSQMGAITSVGLDASKSGGNGSIACDGTIIINRDCKLTCSGIYGLRLGEGAQVVNYGQIISENLEIYSDHTIENRGDSSAVFAGWGVTDSGYALTRTSIVGQTYNAKGTCQKVAAVMIPENGVYGDGADRLYVNPAGSVTYTQPSRKSGYVSGYSPKLDSYEEESEPLPATVTMYYDEEYNTSYIVEGGVIYHYDGIAGRWVNVENGGNETYFDYRMPSVVEEYQEGKLPEGYVLSSGVVVGQKQRDDLKWDHYNEVFWFTEDERTYYYEIEVGAYIHAEIGSYTYYRYNRPVSDPSFGAVEYIPSNMYANLPYDTVFYREGMTETANPEGLPKVQVEGSQYYVEVEGTRYYWVDSYQMFIPKKYTTENGRPVGLTEDQVDVGWYMLDQDPNGKPKVRMRDGIYYLVCQGGTYFWSSADQCFYNGSAERHTGDPLHKSDVDLNGYTLP